MKQILYSGILLLLITACHYPATESTPQAGGRQVDLAWGKKIYERNCAGCHDDGSNGAQITGDIEGWRSRIARGVPSLISNAINGFSGALGYMPPRGNNPALSHEDVTAATWYIVSLSSEK